MAMIITLKTQLFRGDWDQARSQYSLLWFMEALCRVNQSHIRQFRHLYRDGKIAKPYPRIYKSGIHYERERGTEEWLDIPTVLAGGSYPGEFPGPWGDCLPVSTKLFKSDGTFTTMGQVQVGDEIASGHGWTTVLAHAVTGPKPILEFTLDNGSRFECSPDHRVFLVCESKTEIRADKVKVGDNLIAGAALETRVLGIRELPQKNCADITTDKGFFWTPESDLIVHNCEDLACWRVAELRERPARFGGPCKAKPFAKFRLRDDGSYAYHALVLLPSGRLEDPSLTMGMGWEKDFHEQGIAGKYMRGELPIQVRFAEKPDIVVVDPESPTGYSSAIRAAQRKTGLAEPIKLANGANVVNATAAEVGAWGYNRAEVKEDDMQELRRVTVGFRSGRQGRLGRMGYPDAAWAARFKHINDSISYPKI